MDSHQLIHQDSGNTEYWTPVKILEAAREVLGQIDFDPASCEGANDRVKAKRFLSAPEFQIVREWGGLPVRQYEMNTAFRIPWRGRVWLNHPFAVAEAPCKKGCTKQRCIKRGWHTLTPLPGNADWVGRLLENYTKGYIGEALSICFAATSERWFRPLMQYPQCFLSPRLNYDTPDGKAFTGSTKGSVVTYLGKDVKRFANAFYEFGEVKVHWLWQ
ncbi:MAG: hypothetical protein KA314_04675 [Chloroflexi bacterium]|nr:hypothetical protein [Chloroflexota bacterium]